MRTKIVRWQLGVILPVALLISGCSALSPSRLPTEQSLRSGWTLNIEFESVVNLPSQSKVVVNGVDGGVVSSTRIAGKHAVVALTIDDDVAVSDQAIAEIKQDTLLGDTYVNITNSANLAGTRVAKGGTLPIGNTRKPVQIEPLMEGLANFLGSGSLPQLGTTFNAINGQFPSNPNDVRRIETTLLDTLRAWADDTDSLNTLLTGAATMSDQLVRNMDVAQKLLSDDGVRIFKTGVAALPILELIGKLSTMTKALPGAVPMLNSITDVVNGVVKPILIPGWPSTTTSLAEEMLTLLTDKLIPYFQKTPKANIRQLAIDNKVPTRTQADLMVRTMRMLGMVP